jgi:hypothetical protein
MAIIKGPVNPVISGTTTFPDLKSVQVTAPNRHSVKPSLVLDFANSKTLDPRITFTRGSNATYYDGTTAVAEQNLLINSQVFSSGSPWANVDNTTFSSNYATAPDGTTTATKLIPTTTNAIHRIFTATIVSAYTGGWVTYSVYAKADGYSQLGLFVNGPDKGVLFDLSAGTASDTLMSPYTGATYSITSVGSGWYRCVMSAYSASNPTITNVQLQVWSSSTQSYAGNGTSGIAVWGAQFETRSSVTGYTPTTTTAITNYIPVLKTAGPNQPRFDVDPVTQESKGLLIEEQRTNLISTSEGLTSWAVDGTGSVVIDNSINPRGQFGGWITKYAGYAYNAFGGGGVTSGQTYTYSVYIKKTIYNTTNTGLVSLYSPSTQVLYNFSTGTVSLVTGSPTSYGCQKISDTIARVWMTVTAATTSIGIGAFDAATNSVMLWGLQIEAGAFPTSYIPTISATATRAMDAAVMSGSNFSSWFNNTEGTVYGQVSVGQGFFPNVFTVNDGTNNNAFYVSRVSSVATPATTLRYQWTNAAGVVNDLGPGNNVFAAAYKQANYQMGNNGTVGTASTTAGAIPVLNAMNIGNFPSGAFPWNGYIKKLAYYPVRLTSSELQGLTAS